MYIRPPWRSALLPFYKFFLEQDVEEAPVAAISDIYIDGECYVRLIMKDQHKPTAKALSMDKLAPGSEFQCLDHAGEMKKMRVSGIQQAPNQLYAHGTDVIHLKPIMATRRLLPGATCHPIGCYGFPATSENITAGYDVGAVVLAEFKGCLLDSKCGDNWFFEQRMPAGSVGCLRHDKRRKMYQFVCHPGAAHDICTPGDDGLHAPPSSALGAEAAIAELEARRAEILPHELKGNRFFTYVLKTVSR